MYCLQHLQPDLAGHDMSALSTFHALLFREVLGCSSLSTPG
jgi:hypothetical protein